MPSISSHFDYLANVTWDDALGPHVYVFYAAFIVSFIFTPVMRQVAIAYDIVDRPDHHRKMHTSPIAFLGGVAVFMGWVAGLAMSQLHIPSDEIGDPHLSVKMCLVAGAGVICALGLWDDLRRIPPLYKIAGEIIAALLLLSQGVGIRSMDPIVNPLNLRIVHALGPQFQIPVAFIPYLSALLVIFIVVGCCNATNLLDGQDGLCGGVTGIIAVGFLFLAVHLATTVAPFSAELNPIRIVLTLALLGAVLGFIPYNFNPASIFMGDTGSLFLGYACATIIVLLAEENSKWLLAALVIFALPILDTSLAFARRWVNGRPLFSADRYHFHHQLVARGYSVKVTVLLSYTLALGFCGLGILIAYMRVRYAIAFYLVIFGSIIVAAYKMGMVHEKPRVVSPKLLGDGDTMAPAPNVPTSSVLEIQSPSDSSEPQISAGTRQSGGDAKRELEKVP